MNQAIVPARFDVIMSMKMSDENELSEREREILRLVATGVSNKEIARALVISPNTVKVHLRNIFAKVGVASRTEATLYAIRIGLLPAPTSEVTPPAPAAVELPGPVTVETQKEDRAASEVEETRAPAPRRWLLLAALGLAVAVLILVGSYWLREARAPENAQPAPVAAVPVRWSARAALPEPVSALAGAVYENRVYISGGAVRGGVSAKTWAFDPAANEWQARADKPTATSQMQAALLGEKIYFPGGRLADGSPTDRMEVYDPRLDRWESAANLPRALCGYGLAVQEGQMYLIGGWDGVDVVNSVYAYNPGEDHWETRSAMPAGRAYLAAAALGGKILAVGGWDGQHAVDTVEAYYPSRDPAGEQAWEPRTALPQPRYAMGAAAMADVVYLVGGKGESGVLAPVQYLLQTGGWSAFDDAPLPSGEWVLLLPLETHLHALGGEQNGQLLAQHQAYQAIYNVMFPVIQ